MRALAVVAAVAMGLSCASCSVRDGTFTIEGALSGGDHDNFALDVHRVVESSGWAKDYFKKNRCTTVKLVAQGSGNITNLNGRLVPLNFILMSGTYLRVEGHMSDHGMIYDKVAAIPFPDDVKTVKDICPTILS